MNILSPSKDVYVNSIKSVLLSEDALKYILNKNDYPASNRSVEILLAETKTICSNIMLPY